MKTTAEVLQEQKEQAAAEKAQKTSVPVVSNGGTGTDVAIPGGYDPIDAYIDAVAPSGIAGRLVKFDGKRGCFITSDDGEEMDSEADYVALCDQTLIGWIRFHGKDTPPERVQGLLYGDFRMPKRESLGDTDESQWEVGLSGKPEDPWQH